jgi:predicted HTH transcriptional regulator
MGPFVEYTLRIILKAYRELESRVEGLITARMSKSERIRAVVKSQLGKVTKKDIITKCPDISTAMVEMVLKSMLDEGLIRKVGGGRGTGYIYNT